MQYRPFGKLGYDVSLLGLGCMRLPRMVDKDGNAQAQVDKEKAFELIRYAADHGINYFDTAYGYHSTHSESILGEALEGGYRQRVHIATKQPFNVMTTQADIRKNLEATLKKLRTDYIDVYLVHNIMDRYWDEIQKREVLREYEKFKEEGLIGAIAFSYHGGFAGFQRVLEAYPWDMCQVQQNILDVDHEVTAEAIRIAGEKGCALVIMEPLRGGGLANAPKDVQAVYDTYPEKRTPVQWAFRHLWNYPQVSTILSGMTTLEQLKQNIETFSAPDAVPGSLTPEEAEILRRAKATYESRVTVPCTGCEYCMPCPSNVDIPGVFQRYNAGMMFESFDNQRRTYTFLTGPGKDASQCIECGLCEQQCPQSIPIIEKLKVAHQLLDGWKE